MSADNGIYILITALKYGKDEEVIACEYRVRELQAVENLYYDEFAPAANPPDRSKYKDNSFHSHYEYIPDIPEHMAYREAYNNKYHSHKSDVMIRNARIMWRNCTVYDRLEDALMEAYNILNKADYPIEYGISSIEINEVF